MPFRTDWHWPRNDKQATDERLPSDNLTGVPGGPGEHGFSGVYGKATPVDDWPAEPVRRSESPGMASDIRRLAESVGVLDRAGEYKEPPLRSRADRATSQAQEPDSVVFTVSYRNQGDAVTVHRFQTDLEAGDFVEELLIQGVRKADIEIHKAYALPFDARLNPSVRFSRS